ncbi:DUF6779 domain-containing protein [Actinokineospora sp.]|uniref:DUF6779 domain-containing protein n=1 Tax=Actinokineospora sp. TaxID=1872133 RepID=UPI004037BF7F
MTGRTDSSAEQDASSRGGRILLVAALVLALGSTAVLVLSDSVRWMRLGIVAALWAALAGAFLAARYRRQIADRAEEAVELQQVYELELEREVAARREYELEVEAEAKRKAEEQARDDLAELRDELRAMRENLELLLGGEVLVERFALHAEATRMRGGLAEDRAVGQRANGQVRRIAAAIPGEADTELIERVRAEQAQAARASQRRDFTPHPAEMSDRWFAGTPNAERIDPDWTPSWETGEQPLTAGPRPARPADAAGRPAGRPDSTGSQPVLGAAARSRRPDHNGSQRLDRVTTEHSQSMPAAQRRAAEPGRRVESSQSMPAPERPAARVPARAADRPESSRGMAAPQRGVPGRVDQPESSVAMAAPQRGVPGRDRPESSVGMAAPQRGPGRGDPPESGVGMAAPERRVAEPGQRLPERAVDRGMPPERRVAAETSQRMAVPPRSGVPAARVDRAAHPQRGGAESTQGVPHPLSRRSEQTAVHAPVSRADQAERTATQLTPVDRPAPQVAEPTGRQLPQRTPLPQRGEQQARPLPARRPVEEDPIADGGRRHAPTGTFPAAAAAAFQGRRAAEASVAAPEIKSRRDVAAEESTRYGVTPAQPEPTGRRAAPESQGRRAVVEAPQPSGAYPDPQGRRAVAEPGQVSGVYPDQQGRRAVAEPEAYPYPPGRRAVVEPQVSGTYPVEPRRSEQVRDSVAYRSDAVGRRGDSGAYHSAAASFPDTAGHRHAEPESTGRRAAPETGGRRAKPDEDDGGGRRRRAEGAPSWHDAMAEEPAGSHTAGKSVSELLAAHGGAATPPRRRRRREED